MWNLDHKEGCVLKNWCFWTVVLEKTLPWTARRSNQSILKEISSEYSLEELKLNLQYFGNLMWRTNSLEKTLMLGKIEGRRRRTEDEMVGWYHWLNGHEFEQASGDGEGQGSLVYCSPWGWKESDKTRWLKNNNIKTNECRLQKFQFTIDMRYQYIFFSHLQLSLVLHNTYISENPFVNQIS